MLNMSFSFFTDGMGVRLGDNQFKDSLKKVIVEKIIGFCIKLERIETNFT
jgi:hypothetical protein